MTALLVSWLAFPVVLGLLSLGCGLLVEHLSGSGIPGALLLPVGLAVVIVASLFTTATDSTAGLTVPLVVALAVAGLALSFPWRERRLDLWAAAAAVGAFAVFGAPVLLSGQATFAGYITLDDTSTWLSFADRLLEHGRTLGGLAPSTYQANLAFYWSSYGYPVGAFLPLGVGHAFVGTDAAWLIQPYHAFLAAMLALCLYELLERLTGSSRLRAPAAFVAAQPALLYAYSLWGGVKEVAAAAVLALVAALTPSALRKDAPARSLVPLATATAALIGILNLGGSVWLVPLFLPALAAGVRMRGRAFAGLAAAFAALVAALSVPSLLIAGSFASDVSLNTKEDSLGNLIRPLSFLQLFGIWPVGDFRLRPGKIDVTYVLIGILIASAVAAIAWAWRHRAWALPLYLGAAVVGLALALPVGSPWIDSKALAIASPSIVLAGMAGAAWLARSGRRLEGGVVAAAIAGGVLWSNALAYHDVWLAPRGQLRELERIGRRFAGQGPTLLTEWQPYGDLHFLRHMDPESPGEYRTRVVPLRGGGTVASGGYADIDELQLAGILDYRTLVLVRSPAASRPPSVYRLVWAGRFYDVWRRPATPEARILEHLSLGQGDRAAAVPRCADVLRLAAAAGRAGGALAAVLRAPATVLPLSQSFHPGGWATYSGSPDVVYPDGSGTLEATVRVPAAGRYGVWLGGSFRRSLELSIDGTRVGAARHQLNHLGDYTPLGGAVLQAGLHSVALRYGGSSLLPGSGGGPFPLGPLVLGRVTGELPVTTVQPGDARSLCAKSLDWVEAVEPRSESAGPR